MAHPALVLSFNQMKTQVMFLNNNEEIKKTFFKLKNSLKKIFLSLSRNTMRAFDKTIDVNAIETLKC